MAAKARVAQGVVTALTALAWAGVPASAQPPLSAASSALPGAQTSDVPARPGPVAGQPQGKGVGPNTPTFQGPPAGVQPLPIDLFTSKNFYKDRANWLDKRYYRCNNAAPAVRACGTAAASARSRRSRRRGATATTTGRASSIVSPYPYKTAKEHYEALLAAGEGEGRPDGLHEGDRARLGWLLSRATAGGPRLRVDLGTCTQAPTVLSLLTPEYQKRMVQTHLPRGGDQLAAVERLLLLARRASSAGGRSRRRRGNFQLTMTPWNVQFLSGIADNFLRQVMVGKRARAEGRRSGTARRSASGTARRWSPGRRTSRAGSCRTRCSRPATSWRPSRPSSRRSTPAASSSASITRRSSTTPTRSSRRCARRSASTGRRRRTIRNRRYTFIECLSNIFNTNGRPKQTDQRRPALRRLLRPARGRRTGRSTSRRAGTSPTTARLPQDVLDLFK